MKFNALFFDFDGVILDSVDVKTEAFAQMFRFYGQEVEKEVVEYHLANGGVSRFEKFCYYYDKLLKIPITDEKLALLGKEFSALVVQKVIDSPFVPGAESCLRSAQKEGIPCYIVSGTPEEEIRIIVSSKNLGHFFKEVHGSPRQKDLIVADILMRKQYKADQCLFIGDALSDYDAAQKNSLRFLGIVKNSEDSPFPVGTAISPKVTVPSISG